MHWSDSEATHWSHLTGAVVRGDSGFTLASRPEATCEAMSEATLEAQWEVRQLWLSKI